MKKLFLRSGKLMIGEFPDSADISWQPGNPSILDFESGKASAVEVVDTFQTKNNLSKAWGALKVLQMKEGQLYDLPSGWTVEDGCDEPCIKARRCLIADHENNDNCAQLHGNICQKKKRIARLVPVGEVRKLIEGEYHDAVAAITEAQRRALIDEGAPQKGIIITDNPEEVGQIYDFNQDVTGDKEYGTELSWVDMSDKQLNTLLDKVEGGIVATGIPEAGQHYEYGDVCGKCGSPCSVGPRGLYCSKCEPHRSGEPVPERENQEELWKEAINLYSKRDHSADGRADMMKEFTITRKKP